jgi:hypothetical protein
MSQEHQECSVATATPCCAQPMNESAQPINLPRSSQWLHQSPFCERTKENQEAAIVTVRAGNRTMLPSRYQMHQGLSVAIRCLLLVKQCQQGAPSRPRPTNRQTDSRRHLAVSHPPHDGENARHHMWPTSTSCPTNLDKLEDQVAC